MGGHWGLIEELGGSESEKSVVEETAKVSNEDVEDMEASFNNDDDDENSFSIVKTVAETGYVEDDKGSHAYGSGGQSRPDSSLSMASTGEAEQEVYIPPPSPMVRLQPAFQSGASPAGLSNRFLMYNGVGIIKSDDSDQENSLDVEFHDAVHKALHLSNSEGATMATLSRKVLATATTGDDMVGGKLMVNYFSSCDVNKEWSIVLEEEEIRGVAAGDKWVAVVTSKNYLRMFTAGGLQREVVMVMGPLVTMVGEGDRLLVVTHAGHPLPGQQSLVYTLYSVTTDLKPLNTSPLPLPLAPDSDLYWAGFSDTLTPCTADTAGWLRALDQSTNLWHPMINTRDHVRERSDFYYIISVSHTKAVLRGMLVKGAKGTPTIPCLLPTALPLELPLTAICTDKGGLEPTCLNMAVHSNLAHEMDTVKHSEMECNSSTTYLLGDDNEDAMETEESDRTTTNSKLSPVELTELSPKEVTSDQSVSSIDADGWKRLLNVSLDRIIAKKDGGKIVSIIIQVIKSDIIPGVDNNCNKVPPQVEAKKEDKDANEVKRNGEFFCSLDEDVVVSTKPSCENKTFSASSFQSSEAYVKQLLSRIKDPIMTSYSGNLICDDGQSVSVPLKLLCLAWPSLDLFVKESVGSCKCCGMSDVAISIPCSFETGLLVREMIFSDKVPMFSCSEVADVLSFFDDTFLGLSGDNQVNVDKEDGDQETVIIEEEESFDDDDEGFAQHENLNVFTMPMVCQQLNQPSHCSSSCRNDCDKIVQGWTSENIQVLTGLFSSDKLVERKNKLLAHLISQGNVGSSTESYIIFSHKFCLNYLSFVANVSEYILKTVLCDFRSGYKFYEHGNKGLVKQFSTATMGFIVWFKQFLYLYGQSSPDEMITILAYWLNGKVLFAMYEAEAPKPHVKLATFYSHLKTHFGPSRIDKTLPCVRISAYSSHSVCDICVALQTNQKLCKNEAELQLARALRNQHKDDFGRARKVVESIRQSAIDFPSDNIFIQCDGNYCSLNIRSWNILLL